MSQPIKVEQQEGDTFLSTKVAASLSNTTRSVSKS